MPRKLKTYQTSQGFYDLAIAAPSMKAALEAWGANRNLFHQGFARESDDAEVIAVTMAKPGIVLRRPVGSDEPFSEHARLPTIEALDGAPRKSKARSGKDGKPSKHPKSSERQERKAALAFERERERQERQRKKEEAAAEKARARREATVSKGQVELETAERKHEELVAEIEKDRAAIDRRAESEDARWLKKREALQLALQKAKRIT
jgi:colicin import membrane protein